MTTLSSDGTPTPSASGPRASSEYVRAARWRPSDAAYVSACLSLLFLVRPSSQPPVFSFLLSAPCCLLFAVCCLLFDV
jgi:hypothetical protein